MEPKNYELEHTKPLFSKHNLLSVHNLHKVRLFMETFKIIKKHIPISIFSLFTINSCSNKFLLIPPKHNLDISKNNYVNKACVVWNAYITKLLTKIELDFKCRILIPGSSKNSDLSASTGYIKHKLISLLQISQKSGDPDQWEQRNFLGR